MSVSSGPWILIASDSLELEIAKNPDVDRRDMVRDLLRLATRHVAIGEQEAMRAGELAALRFGAYYGLHLACAESADVGVFLTTDDQLLRSARRNAGKLRLRVVNPVQWLTEVGS